MKSSSLISTGTLCFALMACSTAAEAPFNAAGATGTSGGSSNGSAGTGTSAGSSSVGSAGVANTGGTMGGVAGTAGSTGGAASTGGSVGAGGASGGSSAGSSGGIAGGGAVVDPTLTGAWDGALLTWPCDSGATVNFDCKQPSSYNCKNATANSGPFFLIPPANNAPTSWKMGGTSGTNYNVTVRVQGVIEVSSYHNGTRAAGDPSINTSPRNTFQTGGTGLLFGESGYDYNQFELDVTPGVTAAKDVYFLNSVKDTENPHVNNSPTTHLTFDVDYVATIKLPGGSTVSLTDRDSNCVQVQNCGLENQGGMCGSPRARCWKPGSPPMAATKCSA